jgi:hypothetical protein
MSGAVRRWCTLLAVLTALVLVVAAQVDAQRAFSRVRIAEAQDFDGSFQFCRVAFRSGGFGSTWDVDFPRADINLSIRLSELTKTNVSRTDGVPNHLLVRLTDPALFQCPFIMMTEVGGATFTSEEAERLREYLLKGGFLWADDFWGEAAWEWWAEEFERVLPSKDYPFVDLDPSHPLFRSQFVVAETPQITSINFWYRNGGDTSERGADSAVVHTRAILDAHGRMMTLVTHNTDFGDSFEREGDDPTYFLNFSVPGYAFGINALLHAMTH